MSKSTMFLVNITDTPSSVQALLDSRTYMNMSPLDPKPIAMAGTFAFIEQARYTDGRFRAGVFFVVGFFARPHPSLSFPFCLNPEPMLSHK